MDLGLGLDQIGMGQGVAHPPAGHGEALGQAVHHGHVFGIFGPPFGTAGGFGRGIDQLVVNFVGYDEYAPGHGPIHDGVQLLLGMATTSGI